MADCQPAYNFCSFLPLSYLFPNFLFSSFLVLVLPSFPLSVSFLSCLVFPSLVLSFFLSFFRVLVFLFPVCLVCLRRVVLSYFIFTFLPACIRMLPVCRSYELVCDSYVYSYVLICIRMSSVCTRMCSYVTRM